MDECSQVLAEWVFVDGEASASKLHRQNLIHEAQESPKNLKGEEQFEKSPNCSYSLFFPKFTSLSAGVSIHFPLVIYCLCIFPLLIPGELPPVLLVQPRLLFSCLLHGFFKWLFITLNFLLFFRWFFRFLFGGWCGWCRKCSSAQVHDVLHSTQLYIPIPWPCLPNQNPQNLPIRTMF